MQAFHARGIALLTALVLLAITSAIAFAMSFDTGLAIRRAAGAIAQEQAAQLATAAEALAARVLAEQLEDSSVAIHARQNWAGRLGPIEVAPGAVLEAQLQDLQGRFNVNSLIQSEGTADPAAMRVFGELLQRLELEPRWVSAVVDWIDADTLSLEGGAEDLSYSALTPGYRPPNRPLTSISEILSLDGFGIERYRKLAPHITALPRDAGLNVCSATGPLLDAISGEQQWSEAEESLQRNRDSDCFPRLDAIRNGYSSPEEFATLEAALGLGETSRYFQLESRVTVGTSIHTLYSLLRYDTESRQMRVILRHTAP